MYLTERDVARFRSGLAAPDSNGCRLWTRCLADTGYGNFRAHGVTYLTHRVAYFLAHGRIPEGLHIDHLCRVRACAEPSHLEAVTPAVNNERAMPWRQPFIECKRGHPLTNDNVRRYNGSRFCIACDRIRGAAYRARKKEQA